jgi:hypothetical protein
VPVSREWVPSADSSGCKVPSVEEVVPTQNLKLANGSTHEGFAMDIIEAIHAIALGSGPGPQAGEPIVENESDDFRHFIGSVFSVVPTSALPPPDKQRRKGGLWLTSAEPSHRSSKQAAKKTVVLVSQRATNCLIKELDLVGSGQPIAEAAKKKFSELFQEPLAHKSIAAIRVATRLADDYISRAAAAMAANEMVAQAEATTA